MLEGVLFGAVILVVLAAVVALLNWLSDHGRAFASALVVAPILLWIWWQEWFGNVYVFALIAIVLIGTAAWVPEALTRLRNRRAATARSRRRECE
jgi:hypothetical protein